MFIVWNKEKEQYQMATQVNLRNAAIGVQGCNVTAGMFDYLMI